MCDRCGGWKTAALLIALLFAAAGCEADFPATPAASDGSFRRIAESDRGPIFLVFSPFPFEDAPGAPPDGVHRAAAVAVRGREASAAARNRRP